MTTLYCKACGEENPDKEPMAAVWSPCRCGNRSWSTVKPMRLMAKAGLNPRLIIYDDPQADPRAPWTLTQNDRLFLRTFCIEAT